VKCTKIDRAKTLDNRYVEAALKRLK